LALDESSGVEDEDVEDIGALFSEPNPDPILSEFCRFGIEDESREGENASTIEIHLSL
jgi:hypothetical protein